MAKTHRNRGPSRNSGRSVASDPIEHVFYLMLENRSFDHMLGSLQKEFPDLDGIDPGKPPRSNLTQKGRPIQQLPISERKIDPDPHHAHRNVMRQIDGGAMTGFVRDYETTGSFLSDLSDAQLHNVMGYYPELKVLHYLARNFTVCDRWFCSVPGPTWTNRLFALSGTSQGWVRMPGPLDFARRLHRYDQDTIFDRLSGSGRSYRIYHGGIPLTLLFEHERKVGGQRHYYDLDLLFNDIKTGNVVDFNFIEPDHIGADGNSDHPPYDILLGQNLVGRIYHALRTSAIWQKSLLIITYDEHGGFYDHVRPEACVPPDSLNKEGFDFRKLGVRVPAVLVSPFVKREVCHTIFDHTSVLRYLIDKWSLQPLGDRVKNANSIGDLIEKKARSIEPAPDEFGRKLSASRSMEDSTPLTEHEQSIVLLSEVLEDELLAPGLARSRDVVMRRRKMLDGPEAIRDVARERSDELRKMAATSRGKSPRTKARDIARGSTSSAALKVLCIHGISGVERTAERLREAEAKWTMAVQKALRNSSRIPQVYFLQYDDVFAATPEIDYAAAVTELISSWLHHGRRIAEPESRGLGEEVRWTAGMVAQWATNDALRAALRERLKESMEQLAPHIVAAHSLGSLISYDTFATNGYDGKDDFDLLTFGSQIGHPGVRRLFGGYLVMPHVRRWRNLFNANDGVFTRSLSRLIRDEKFQEIATPFDSPGPLNHDAEEYLTNGNTMRFVWPVLTSQIERAAGEMKPAQHGPRQISFDNARVSFRFRTEERALIIGIDNYPDPAHRLKGCQNDAMAMRKLLEQRGWQSSNIRMLLNNRATTSAILERMEWLLDSAGGSDRRILFYAGHGARLPGYNALETVDGKDECLVPVDFDWSPDRAILDDNIFELYSQLPYETNLAIILDCCHSGGMTRSQGSGVRGLVPPPDILNRFMHYGGGNFWQTRDLPRKKEAGAWFGKSAQKSPETPRSKMSRYLGAAKDLHRLGTALNLWSDKGTFQSLRDRFDHRGPFMPLTMYACGEEQTSEEFVADGNVHGLFTYFLIHALQAGKGSLDDVMASVADAIGTAGYKQRPELHGPAVKEKRTLDKYFPGAGTRKGKSDARGKRKAKRR